MFARGAPGDGRGQAHGFPEVCGRGPEHAPRGPARSGIRSERRLPAFSCGFCAPGSFSFYASGVGCPLGIHDDPLGILKVALNHIYEDASGQNCCQEHFIG